MMWQLLPLIEKWLRATMRDEVAKALAADRMAQKPKRTYTRDEVAKMARISLPTLWQRVKDGKITPIKNGRRVVFQEDEVKRFLAMEG